MLAKITISDYMTSNIQSVKPEMNAIGAIKRLLDHKVTCAPVLDPAGNILGMFSEVDCMKIILETAYNQGMSGSVSDYMSTNVISVDADLSIVELAEKFKASSVRSFPVYRDNELVGVISRTDILKALVSHDRF